MATAWIFQANPERYNIDAAVQALDEIRWRVPQHTAEISPGDAVAIWRAGSDAGIVAVGAVTGHPRAEPSPSVEDPFQLIEGEGDVVTRVPVRIRACDFIPRAGVAALPEMEGHQILTAPRVTVYPLQPAQWEALRTKLPEPPSIDALAVGHAPDLPQPFAWRDRRRSVHPLPGGYDSYLKSLQRILSWVADRQPDRQDLESWLRTEFALSESYARFIVDFLEGVGFIRGTTGRYEPTPELRQWQESEDSDYLIGILHSRVQFIGEMLAVLSSPQTSEHVHRVANEQYGMRWSTRAQIDRRRGWLQSSGLLVLDEEGRLAVTSAGRALLDRLEVQEPQEMKTVIVEEEEPAPEEVEPVEVEADVSDLLGELRGSAHNTADPAALEKAVRDAFAFLGFEATWLGGAGRTDVLLVADLGPTERYRVVVDCKTTSHEAVPDHQIDWMTLREHKGQFEGDYVALVAPAFRGDRLANRAAGERVALIDVEQLAGLCEQHASVPLGLDVYRDLFSQETAEAGAAGIGETGQETERWLALSAHVVRLIRKLESNEASLGPRDLYWNLTDFNDRYGRVTEEEIQTVLESLSSPAIGLLRKTDDGFKSLGSLETVARRLHILGRMIGRSMGEPTERGTPDGP
jgi:hypothetical protein